MTYFSFPEADINYVEKYGREFLDANDIELWIRAIANALQNQDAPFAAVQCAIGIADTLKNRGDRKDSK